MALLRDSQASFHVKAEPTHQTFPIYPKSGPHGVSIGFTTTEALAVARDLIVTTGGIDKDIAVKYVGEAIDTLMRSGDAQ